MKYPCNNKQYKAFLCYRRKQTNPQFAASEDVAGMLHWWLNCDPSFENIGPALFEECYPVGGGLTYDERGLETFMPQIKICFVVICSDFFQRILSVFRNVLIDNFGKTEQELLQITREKLSSNDRDICYLEIRHVLRAKDCRVIPVLVRDGNQDAYSNLENRDTAALKKILGQGSEILFDTINTCTVDYQKFAPHMEGLHWTEADKQTVQTRMKIIEESEEGKKFLRCLKQMLQPTEPQPRKNAVNINALLADLRCCARTFLELQQPSGDNQDFCASNPKVVYDPIRSSNMEKDPQVKPPFLADCLVESFKEHQKAFGLQSDRFRYWKVNLSRVDVDTQNQQSIPLSVCAVCFGTLSVHHYLSKECIFLEGLASDYTASPLLDTVQSGLNLLLALRNPYTKTWPSTWEFNNKAGENIGVEGTTNQTTLSLSTLMSCGFLAPDIAPEFLKARYAYVWESIDVLLSWGVARLYNRKVMGWRYTSESKNAPALLPTIFVFDTLCKLRQCICELIPVFSNDAFASQLRQDLHRIEDTLNETLAFIAQKQCTEGSNAPGAFRRFASEEYSVTHTAYVIKSLYQYVQSYDANNNELERILTPAIDYLVKKMESMKQAGSTHFQQWEWCEDFCDSDPNDNDNAGLKSTFGEQYEHSAELIVGEALIKIAENCRNEELYAKIMDLLQWLFEEYAEKKRVIGVDGETIRIRGVRDFLPYPIYCLYYYRMFLWDYLLLLKKKEG